jgi:hypothetical protein
MASGSDRRRRRTASDSEEAAGVLDGPVYGGQQIPMVQVRQLESGLHAVTLQAAAVPPATSLSPDRSSWSRVSRLRRMRFDVFRMAISFAIRSTAKAFVALADRNAT